MIQVKRVLFILHLPPPVHGSSMVGKYIKDSKLINQVVETNYINLGTSKTIDEIGKNPLGKIRAYVHIVFKTLKSLLFFKPDIVYLAITAKGIGFYKDSLIALLVKLFGVKLVLHFHNKGVVVAQDKFVDNLLYKRVFKNTKVILLSKYLYYDVQKYVSEQNVYFCANGIPLICNESSFKDTKNEIPSLLFLSNLIESKGVFILLDALKILQEKGILFTCNFVGGEGDVSSLDFNTKVSELKLEKKVFYLGKKYNQEKVTIFKESDIFVHPTFSDCFPLVLLEASQFGLPMVAAIEGAIPEIVENGKNGFLVKRQDVVGLAAKLEQLILNPALRIKMGQAAKEKYNREYTLEFFERKMLDILTLIQKSNNK